MKTYKMTTNAIKWKITDDKDTDETHQQGTSPSKENKDHCDCLKDKSLMLIKNMAKALDVSKRYYEQLKRKTLDQKQDKKNNKHLMCVTCTIFEKRTSGRCGT
jgi:hypothetical protein